MPRKESANEAYLRKRVNETRGFVRKVKWPGVRGAPDDLVMWPHLKTYSFVELKEESQDWKLQPHQAREIDRMRCSGMNVAILDSPAAIDSFIRLKTGK
jgi:hypothetical protein